MSDKEFREEFIEKPIAKANKVINDFKKQDDILVELTTDIRLLLEVRETNYDTILDYFVAKYSYLLLVRNNLPTELRRIQYHISNVYKNRSGPTKAIVKLINQLEKAKSMQWEPKNDSNRNEKVEAVQSDTDEVSTIPTGNMDDNRV